MNNFCKYETDFIFKQTYKFKKPRGLVLNEEYKCALKKLEKTIYLIDKKTKQVFPV